MKSMGTRLIADTLRRSCRTTLMRIRNSQTLQLVPR